MFIEHSLLHM